MKGLGVCHFKTISSRSLLSTLMAVVISAPVAAEPSREERDRLAAYVQAHPEDDEAAYRFVILTAEVKDYEAGVGALERVLMFNPKLARARKELGFLYSRLGNWDLAAQYLREARESGALDDVQNAQIDAQLPDIEKRTQRSRLSVFLQTGLRAQSNANYFPANSLFQLGGAGVFSQGSRRGDVNTFQLVEASHDYDFNDQSGDRLETRVTAYATQQFQLPQYSLALFGGSIGPRFYLPSTAFGSLSLRPYLTGAVSLLGSTNYLDTGGAGASLRADVTPDAFLEPGVEWRSLSVASVPGFIGISPYATLSTLATGSATTGYVNGGYAILDRVRLEGRFGFTRASAFFAPQSSNQVDAQALLRVEVDPPYPIFARRWTIAPYARFTHLNFDAPNPLVSPFVARRDTSWNYGIMLDAPVSGALGFSGRLDFSRNDSNLPNFRTQNVSVTFGPTAKF